MWSCIKLVRLLLSGKSVHENTVTYGTGGTTVQISMLKSVVYGRSFFSERPTWNEKTVTCITLQHTYFNAFEKGACQPVY